MIKYPNKRVFGLMGGPRTGKGLVGKYLQESRGFIQMAFADRIKEEYGISLKDFDAAKDTKDIERLRKELWKFSASKKKKDPEYFIRLVMEKAAQSERSVVITDIRTENEFNALFEYLPANIIKRVYMVGYSTTTGIKDSEISKDFYSKQLIEQNIRNIDNKKDGLYKFHMYLNNFFFKEDVVDLSIDINYDKYRNTVCSYISQFNIIERDQFYAQKY